MSVPRVPLRSLSTESTLLKHAETINALAAALDGVGTGGAAAWGDITGTLSAQTDLQTALDAKQPLDADLTALAAAGNSGVLAATTASFLAADETKLDGIAAGATVGATWGSNVSGQPSVVSQIEAETGTATTERMWTAERVAQAIAALAGGGSPQLIVPIHAAADSNVTLTNQANSEQFLGNSNRNIHKVDLTNFTQVRLVARVVTGSASANTPRLYAEYHTSFTTTIGTYSDIGTSAVNVSLTTAGFVDSGWVNLAAGAIADVFVTVLQNGGDGAADPAVAAVALHFR